ncbi:hypothetical protein [Aggregatibacter segnis]|uniref:hypothetical protein n=1 Tax=Aggregatibacter segnis TaxID=739 RepID=UPI00288985D5|nr:hypothetical protein [Aggregatibacter segnis]
MIHPLILKEAVEALIKNPSCLPENNSEFIAILRKVPSPNRQAFIDSVKTEVSKKRISFIQESMDAKGIDITANLLKELEKLKRDIQNGNYNI